MDKRETKNSPRFRDRKKSKKCKRTKNEKGIDGREKRELQGGQSEHE